MTSPSLFGWILLGWLLLVLPRGALRSARLFRQAAESGSDAEIPTRSSIFAGTLLVLGITFVQAWFVAGDYGWNLFSIPQFGLREAGAGLGALLVMLGLRQVNYVIRTPEERATMMVHKLQPRNGTEWAMYGVTSISAGIAEEAAYRGAIMSVLIGVTGLPWVAVLVSAVAFAVGHALQGWKSGVVVFFMALAMHALVLVTGTLVVAMVVHAGYDLMAGVLGARERRGGELGDRE